MNRVESVAQETSDEVTALDLGNAAMRPVSCTWAVAAAVAFGAAVGTYFAHLQCQNHGCVQNASEGLEINRDLAGLTVGDMVSVRAEVACRR